MAESTPSIKKVPNTGSIDQHKDMAMGGKVEGEPSFGCMPASAGSVKFGRKAAVGKEQKLPGFPTGGKMQSLPGFPGTSAYEGND